MMMIDETHKAFKKEMVVKKKVTLGLILMILQTGCRTYEAGQVLNKSFIVPNCDPEQFKENKKALFTLP